MAGISNLSVETLADLMESFMETATANRWSALVRHDTARSMAVGLLRREKVSIMDANIDLRDWFAGLAMQGMVSESPEISGILAQSAYAIANVMMAERAKSEGKT